MTSIKPKTAVIFLFLSVFTCCVSLKPYFRLNCGGPSTGNLIGDRQTDYLTRWGNSNYKYISSSIYIPQEKYRKYRTGYKTERWNRGSFGYTAFGIEPGTYTCTFHFAETSNYFAVQGRRVFKVKANNRKSSNIDVWSRAGGRMYRGIAVTLRNILVSSTIKSDYQEKLKISIIKGTGDPIVSAITCEQQTAPQLRTSFAVNAGGLPVRSYVSDLPQYKPSWLIKWGSTRFSSDPKYLFPSSWDDWQKELLRSERFAVLPNKNFGYTVNNLSPGSWKCRLYFSETYHNAAGQRVFYAYVNGIPYRLDVLNLSGKFKLGKFSVPDFYVSGSISISFQRIKGDPMISGFYCNRKNNWSGFSRVI